MARLVFQICLLSLALVCVLSENPAEGLNIYIREQLQEYEKFLSNDDGTHKEDLKKLITIYESALKTENFDEKQALIAGVTKQFSPEFGAFVQSKLMEDQLAEDILAAISFYKSLEAGGFKADIEKTVAELEGLQKITDVEARKTGFVNLEKTFSPEFVNFLKQSSVPKINHDLQDAVEFFEKLLADSEVKYATEIKALKEQAAGAIADTVSVDAKQKTLFEIRNPANQELTEFLKKKFVELS